MDGRVQAIAGSYIFYDAAKVFSIFLSDQMRRNLRSPMWPMPPLSQLLVQLDLALCSFECMLGAVVFGTDLVGRCSSNCNTISELVQRPGLPHRTPALRSQGKAGVSTRLRRAALRLVASKGRGSRADQLPSLSEVQWRLVRRQLTGDDLAELRELHSPRRAIDVQIGERAETVSFLSLSRVPGAEPPPQAAAPPTQPPPLSRSQCPLSLANLAPKPLTLPTPPFNHAEVAISNDDFESARKRCLRERGDKNMSRHTMTTDDVTCCVL